MVKSQRNECNSFSIIQNEGDLLEWSYLIAYEFVLRLFMSNQSAELHPVQIAPLVRNSAFHYLCQLFHLKPEALTEAE